MRFVGMVSSGCGLMGLQIIFACVQWKGAGKDESGNVFLPVHLVRQVSVEQI